jgi:hypothetical protein
VASSLPARVAALSATSRHAVLAGGIGGGLGTFAAGVAYAAYVRAGGPTLAGAVVIPLSVVIVAAVRLGLARRQQRRASDWVVLGYTGGIVLATVLLTVEEALFGLYAELDRTGW